MSDAATEALSGALGSIVSLLATYPLKTIYTLQAIKVKRQLSAASLLAQQQQQQQQQSDVPAANGNVDIEQPQSTTTSSRCSSLFADLPMLFAGIQPALVETALSQGIYFYLYSLQKNLLLDAKRSQPPLGKPTKHVNLSVAEALLVAAVAGAGNMLVTSPAQVVATRQQSDHSEAHRLGKRKKSAVETAGCIYEEDGLGGFWRGVLPNLILVVNPAIQYMLFEAFMARRKRHIARTGAPRALGAGEVFAMGALAKLGATVVTYPMIVVKSRLQAAGKASEQDSKASSPQYTGTLDVVTRMAREEGLGGFYKGINAKMLQTVLNAAIMLMLKEKLQHAAGKLMAARQKLLVVKA